jgi:Flp pilus assembly protein TadD
VAVTLAAYEPTLHNSFVNYDDNLYITENPLVIGGITPDSFVWAFTQPNDYMWHPLTTLSHMLDCQFFDLKAPWHHFVSLLFHIVNVLLVFWIFSNFKVTIWPGAFIAAIFALHPMQVESVAWAAERKTVLSGLFWLLTISVYIWYTKRPIIGRYILLFLVYGLCIMTKPVVVTLPFVLLLLDYWPLERFGRQRAEEKVSVAKVIGEKIPLIALSVTLSVITFLVQLKSNAVINIESLPLKDRIANVFLSYTRYIGKLFWPQNLAVFYPFDANSFAFWQVAMCVLLLLVISIFVIRFGRNQKYLPVGWFWFVVTLVPVIGLVQVGLQAFADRYTYIPYIGLFIMIAWGVPELLSKWPQRKIALGLSMVISLTALGICAHRQVSFWNNSFTLFSHAIEVTQNNYIAHNNLGVACNSIGRYQDAVEAYKQAIKIKPDYAEAHYNLGVTYGILGRSKDEIEKYKLAIKIRPAYVKAYYNLGVSYKDLGRYKEAIEVYKQAIKIKPDYAEAHLNLGAVYYTLGRYGEAIEAYKQAIRIKSDFAMAHYALGAAYIVTGNKNSALEECKILKTLNAEKANELFKLINK